ncbi:MAG: hypothetical protein JWO68_2694 [Actinomycetia bacterium]|nr:hypothetical protein [Actinomycetes bacterium]
MERRSLADGIRRPLRLVTVVLAVMLGVTLGLGWFLFAQLQPRVDRASTLGRQVRVGHEALLDQETGLRGWLATGDDSFLTPYRAGRAALAAANRQLDGAAGHDILTLRLAQQAWINGWAVETARLDPSSLSEAEVDRQLTRGKALFNDYRRVQGAVMDRLSRAGIAAQDEQRQVLAGWFVVQAALLGGSLALARNYRRRLVRSVVDPVADLLATMDRIAVGDLDARPTGEGPLELGRIADGLSAMTGALEEREAELATTAEGLRTILELAREIAGSISVRYVAEAAVEAAKRVSQATYVTVRLLDGTPDALLTLAYDSRRPRHEQEGRPSVALGHGPAGEAARDVRTVTAIHGGERTTAYPLVVGARVTGVLKVHHLGVDELTPLVDRMLETLAAHTAAALEAARLHGRAEELSTVDALTGLANRRRLDDDLASECSRSQRYGRPLALVMVDLDRFKDLNDAYGHQHGDEVLERVAAVLSAEVRVTDTVYRYGGEELVIVARESTIEETAEMAERLRRSIENDGLANQRAVVTASFGVAATSWDTTSPEALIAAADHALYDAKRAGRNRVAVAQPLASADQSAR